MKKWNKLIPLSVGLALTVMTGAVFAETANTDKATVPVANQPFEKGALAHGYGHKGNMYSDELLTLLKVDAATLKSELKSGKSLADIAKDKGVAEQKVIDLLMKQATEKIDTAVTNGKLTSEQATQMKTQLSQRVKEQVEHKGAFMGKGGFRGHKGGGFQLDQAATILGMSKDELMTQLKSGKSLADIAKEKGISEDQLVNSLMEKQKEKIQNFVKKKWQPKTDSSQSTSDNAL